MNNRPDRHLETSQRALYTELLGKLEEKLELPPDKPEETHANTLKALWFLAAGHPVSARSAETRELEPLDEPQQRTLRELTARRLKGEPLAFLTGRKTFMGVEFHLNRQVFIPRRETELLVRSILELHASGRIREQGSILCDLGTGCGNIPLILAEKMDPAAVYATDLLEEALEAARENAHRLGYGKLMRFYRGDLFEPLRPLALEGRVDVLTCNPPYISSAKVPEMAREISGFEPREAFDGGAFGVNVLQRLIEESAAFLKPGGWLGFEVGAGQGSAVIKRLRRRDRYGEIIGKEDPDGIVRAVLARRLA